MYRIEQHPILPISPRSKVSFTWKGRALEAFEGETLSSALFASGVRVFGHHAKDGAAQGIFCANGQCAQCLVLADGIPVKSCMELVRPGVRVEPVEGLPELPPVDARRRRPCRGPAHRDRPRPRPDHRRRAGRALGRDRARPARHRDPSHRRQAPARRQARPADPPVLRLHRRGLRRHPGHRHRHPLGERGPLVPRRPGLAPDDGPGRLQRPEGRRPRRGPEICPRRAGSPAGDVRRAGEEPGLSRQHPARRLRRRRLPDARQPGPGQADRAAVHRRRRQRRPHRRLPRPPSRHRRRRAGRGHARMRRLQGPPGQAGPAGRSDLHVPHGHQRQRHGRRRVGHHRPRRRKVPAGHGHRAVLRLRHPPHRRRPRSRQRVLPRRPASSGCRPSPPATPRRSPRLRRPSFRARSGASKWPGPSATTSARSRRTGTGRRTSSSRGRARPFPSGRPGRRAGVFPVLHCNQEIPCDPCTAVCPNDLIEIDENDIRLLPVVRRREGRQGLHGLREVRRHLPGPGRHPRRLPQGRGLSDRGHPLRVPQGHA